MNKDRRAHTGNRVYGKTGGETQGRASEIISNGPLGARMADGPVASLTRREIEVLDLLAEGQSNKEIARALVITTHTVKAHITRILYKLGAESRTEAAVLWATRAGRDA